MIEYTQFDKKAIKMMRRTTLSMRLESSDGTGEPMQLDFQDGWWVLSEANDELEILSKIADGKVSKKGMVALQDMLAVRRLTGSGGYLQ